MENTQVQGDGGAGTMAAPAAHDEVQHHPLKVYFTVWILLFILSAAHILSTTQAFRAISDGP